MIGFIGSARRAVGPVLEPVRLSTVSMLRYRRGHRKIYTENATRGSSLRGVARVGKLYIECLGT